MTDQISDAELDNLIARKVVHGIPSRQQAIEYSALLELRAYRTAANPLQAVVDRFPVVKVRELEWRSLPTPMYSEALVLGGPARYLVNSIDTGWNLWFPGEEPATHKGRWFKNDDAIVGHQQMRAAAQADYERRILSALETTPAPVSQITEEMVERACMAAGKNWELWASRQKRAKHELMRVALTAALTAAMGGGPARQASQAARDVLSERQRQMSAEGWATEHDDAHTNGELATAAGCYALGDKLTMREVDGPGTIVAPVQWPWFGCWWKPKSHRQDLVRSGALIIAEIERLDRTAAMGGE